MTYKSPRITKFRLPTNLEECNTVQLLKVCLSTFRLPTNLKECNTDKAEDARDVRVSLTYQFKGVQTDWIRF